MNVESIERRLVDLANTVYRLQVKVADLEGALAQADKAGKQPLGPTEPKIHGRTLQAMAKYHPPLTADEVGLWASRVPPERFFKTAEFTRRYFPNDAQGKDKAKRVLYWLKLEKVLFFEQGKMAYYKPSGSYVNAGNASN